MELENLSVAELEKILEEETVKSVNLRNKIKTKMLKISVEMKRYEVSTGPKISSTDFNKNIKAQLITKIKTARAYNTKLNSEWNKIKDLTGIQALHSILIGFDNIEASKQVEILRNIGYSEEEIDIILSQIRGDEEYEELKEKANDIIVNWYLDNGGEIDTGFEAVNPYAL